MADLKNRLIQREDGYIFQKMGFEQKRIENLLQWLWIVVRQITCLVVLASSFSSQVFAVNDAQLFEEVFGKQPIQKDQRISVPLIVESSQLGNIDILISGQYEVLKIDTLGFSSKIGHLLQEAVLQKIIDLSNQSDDINTIPLHDFGIDLYFDNQELELHVTIRPEARKTTTNALYKRTPPYPISQALAVSPVSAYLNMRVGVDYYHKSNGLFDGRQPAIASFEQALRVKDWVLEADTRYLEKNSTQWQRGNVRVVHDDTERMWRYALGDLSYPTSGIQQFQPMAGFTLARNFSLQPYRVTTPSGNADLFLNNESTVEVLVNNNVIRVLRLPAGSHNIQDFPSTSGINDIQLRITDSVGRTKTVEVPFLFDSTLLTPRLSEYSYSIGVPSTVVNGKYVYDEDLPGVSLFHRKGITPELTLGVGLQANEDQKMFSFESIWATQNGTFRADIGSSHIRSLGRDHRTRMQYRYFDASHRNQSNHQWTFQLDYTGRYYATLGNLTPDNIITYDMTGNYSRRIGKNSAGGVGTNYQLMRGGLPNDHSLGLFVQHSFSRELGSRISVEKQRRRGDYDYRVFLSLTWTPQRTYRTITATHDTLNDTSRVSWEQISPNKVGGTNLSLGAVKTPDESTLSGRVSHVGYLAETSLSNNIVNTDNPSSEGHQLSSLTFGTALVYAQGATSLTRPVTDSFAIVVPHANLDKMQVGVNPLGDHYAARTNLFGAAVVPDLTSYLAHSVNIDVPNLPLGYDLGDESFVVLPAYKSGTIIHIGTDATVLLGGVLKRSDGSPIGLQAGELVALDNPEWEPKILFTNRSGIFRVEGLSPGLYELRMFNDQRHSVKFEVPEKSAGYYDIGALILPIQVSQK